jgi:hypothetical protein
VWSAISPGRGWEAHFWDEGADYFEEQFRSEVAQPLDSVLVAVMAGQHPSGTSPICDAIEAVYLSGGCSDALRRHRLIVVSDFIENSARFSFYLQRSAPALPCPALDLAGGWVRMIVVLRQRDVLVQNAHLLKLWTTYFRNCGAIVEVDPVGETP